MSESSWETAVYGAGRQINRWPFSELISRTLRSLGNASPEETSVLELGCGTGNNLRFLAEEGFISFGIDSSPTAIEKARELLDRHGLHASLEVGDITDLPWPENSFDLVLDRAALVHNNPDRIRNALKEAHRTMKPGGKLISLGLKSMAHPDLEFGQCQESGAWSRFEKGKFKGLGETSFFPVEEAERLFSDFEAVSVEVMSRSTPTGVILDQEFAIEAFRP